VFSVPSYVNFAVVPTVPAPFYFYPPPVPLAIRHLLSPAHPLHARFRGKRREDTDFESSIVARSKLTNLAAHDRMTHDLRYQKRTEGGGGRGGGRVSRSGMSRYAIPAVFTCALCLCRACVLYLCSHRELSLDLAVLSCAAFTRRSSVTSNRFPPRPFSRCSVPGGTSSSSVRSLVRQYRGKNGRRLGESKLLRALNACRARLDGSLIARNLKRTSLAASRRKCSSAIYSATTRLVPLDSASFEDIEIP